MNKDYKEGYTQGMNEGLDAFHTTMEDIQYMIDTNDLDGLKKYMANEMNSFTFDNAGNIFYQYGKK